MCAILIDVETFDEIFSIVEELLKQPSDVVALLAKKLDTLLSPCYYQKNHTFCRNNTIQRNGGFLDEEHCSSRVQQSKKSSPRHFDTSQNVLFSTTTTATGLPKEEPVPVKTKKLPKMPKEKSPLSTPIELCNGDSECESIPLNAISRRRTCPHLPQTQKFNFSSPSTTRKKYLSSSSDYENGDISPASSPGPRPRSETDIRLADSRLQPIVPTITVDVEAHADSSISNSIFSDDEAVPSSERDNNFKDRRCGFRDYQSDVLDSVYDWNFQIFDLTEKTDNVLSQMAYKLFDCTGLFETFKIPKYEFIHFMMALENGYKSIPYHNKVHAADVLHGCWFLTTQEVPGFHDHFPLCTSDSSDSDSGMSGAQVNDIGEASLAQAIPALELMALYLAAAMHDYDHPGKTNAFLVETRHPLANVYNDRSVLENYHASASWELLYSNKKFDFLRNLDTAEWKRLRFLIVEAVLATDLKKHFEILTQFSKKAKLSPSSSSLLEHEVSLNEKSGLDWSDDQHRLLACQMVIKLADISGPAKVRPLHITWTKAICEEFFLQGDEERKLNMSVSPFMDRHKPQVAELQRTFINNLITPVLLAMHRSGILAGEIPIHDELYSHEKLSREQNLLIEHLRSNLNFWQSTTYRNGHEEMEKSFKFALSHKFSCPSSLEERKRKLNMNREMKLVNGYENEDEVFEITPVATLPNGLVSHQKTNNNSPDRLKWTKPQTKQANSVLAIKDLKLKHGHGDPSHKRHVEKSLTSR